MAIGLGLVLWLAIGRDWQWWTAYFPGWFLGLAVMVLVLRMTAPDNGRATRPDDPK